MGGVEFDVDYYELHPDYDPVILVMLQNGISRTKVKYLFSKI